MGWPTYPWRRIVVFAVGGCLTIACALMPTSDPSIPDAGALHPLDNGRSSAQDAGNPWVDCVGALHQTRLRGITIANAQRFGADAAALRTTSRIADLSPPDLRAFCDWEACIRANGYAHVCALNDAGWESCRVCRGPDDCDGRPMSQDDCAAHAKDVGRAQCHVGLMQECLLQQALRGPADKRVTESCTRSGQACAGHLPGDLTAQALAAQQETDQVTVEEAKEELASELLTYPDASLQSSPKICAWEGGLPPGEDASPADEVICGPSRDAGPADAASKDGAAHD